MTFLSKGFRIWPRRTRYSLEAVVALEDLALENIRMIRKDASIARNLVTSLMDILNYKGTSQRREAFIKIASETNSKKTHGNMG